MSSSSTSYSIAAIERAKLNAGRTILVLENIDRWQVFINDATIQSFRLLGYAWIMDDMEAHFQMAFSSFFVGLFPTTTIKTIALRSAL